VPGPRSRWTAVAGAARGARLGWDVRPAPASAHRPASSIAALTLYPRLEQTGGIPRRFIAAEPLLESGLALALAFVDAVAARDALSAADPGR
jgi:hypothetical protein